MGCCGGNKRRAPSARVMRAAAKIGGRPAGAFNAMSLPGETGMVMLEYLLARAATPYYGAVTNTVYVFGGQRKWAYVDVRDADAMLEIVEGRRPAFRLYQPVPFEAAGPAEAEGRGGRGAGAGGAGWIRSRSGCLSRESAGRICPAGRRACRNQAGEAEERCLT